MIMTIVTQDGKLQAAAAGDLRWSDQPVPPGQFREGLSPLPGQTIQIVEVPDKFGERFAEPGELMADLDTLLRQRGLL